MYDVLKKKVRNVYSLLFVVFVCVCQQDKIEQEKYDLIYQGRNYGSILYYKGYFTSKNESVPTDNIII